MVKSFFIGLDFRMFLFPFYSNPLIVFGNNLLNRLLCIFVIEFTPAFASLTYFFEESINFKGLNCFFIF